MVAGFPCQPQLALIVRCWKHAVALTSDFLLSLPLCGLLRFSLLRTDSDLLLEDELGLQVVSHCAL